MNKVELLAPAGNMETLIGAINAGANAVYIGGKRFGARANADNFSLEQIKEAITFAHLRNARVYVTINTIIFEDELSSFFEYTDALVMFHVDALIVQDYGMLRQLIHRYPETEIHVSTQMNTLNIHQVKFLEDLGVKRIILARETSIELIKQFKEETNIEFEVFAHGALCVSYSGNCYLSQMNGSRSGNRGECAQPCRLPYEMYKDDALFHKEAYLLSTKDLMTLPHLEELIEVGISSLKIEGRMRSLEYTVETIKTYRQYIDEYYGGVESTDIESDIYTLAKLFNRDFTKGYGLGEEPYKINYETRPNHQGVLVGRVINYHYGKTTILLSQTLNVGDGIRIVGKNDIGEQVSKIVLKGETVSSANAGDEITIDLRYAVGQNDLVMKTSDILLKQDALRYVDTHFKLIPLKIEVIAKANEPLLIKFSNGKFSSLATSEYIIEKSIQAGLTEDKLFAQIEKLGNTPYYIVDKSILLEDNLFIPNKVINDTRREALSNLENEILKRNAPVIQPFRPTLKYHYEELPLSILVKVETKEQLEAVKEFEGIEIAIPYDWGNLGEDYIYYLKRIEDPSFLEHNKVFIHDLGDLKIGSFNEIFSSVYMNATNHQTIELLSDFQVSTVTLSMEIGNTEIENIMNGFHQEHQFYPRTAVVGYGRLDSMITKFCPITKAEGINRTDCHICEKFQYSLQNKVGSKYPLKNDGDCNIRVLSSKVRNLIEFLPWMEKTHISKVILDFTIETKEETKAVIQAYINKLLSRSYSMPEFLYTTDKFKSLS